VKYPKTVLAGLALAALGSLVVVSTQAHARIIKSTGKVPAAWAREQKTQRLDQQNDAIKKAQKEAKDRGSRVERENADQLIRGVIPQTPYNRGVRY
jgi:hypothetical protein